MLGPEHATTDMPPGRKPGPQPGPISGPGHRLGTWALRLGLPLGCLAYILHGLDAGAFARVLGAFSAAGFLAMLGYTGLQYLAAALRLRYLSHGGVSLGRAFKAVILCLGVNNILPARLGELTKVAYLKNRAGLPLEQAGTVVFWEGFLDLNALGGCVVMALAVFGADTLPVPLFALILLVWALLALLIIRDDAAALLVRLTPTAKLRELVGQALARLRAQSSPRFFAGAAAWTLGFWLLALGYFALVLLWVAGFSLNPYQLLSVFVAGAMGANLPSSPGGLGVFEGAMVASLGWHGISREEALGAALAMRVLQYLPTTLGALVIMAREGIRPARPVPDSDSGR